MPVSEVNLPELVPQLVTATEFNLNTALDPKNLPTTKNLFEGEGANVRDKLYHDGSFKYKGACFMISSNYLPKASEYGIQVQADVWAPLRARTDIVNFSHSYDEKEKFPYSRTELAHALQFLVDHPLLCKRMEKFEDCYEESDGL